jgi:uncharacterized protein YcfJ
MKLIITSAILLLAVSPLALAKHQSNYHNSSQHSRSEFKAKVINATPIYKYVTVSQPQTYCEPAVTRKTYNQSHDKSAAIVGGIIGGVIGHAASDSKHKGLGTIVGAVIGSSLVHNIENANNKYSRTYKTTPKSCVIRHKTNSKVRVLDGYEVTYRLQGKLYQTFSQEKPTKYIRIYG